MSMLEIFGTIVGDPNFAASVLPDQDLQRKVNRDRGRCHHHRRAALWTAEKDELRRVHLEANFFGFAAVVHAAKNG